MITKSPRETKQRNAIRKAFEETGRPLSPREVLDIASSDVPNLGIATVYRNIKAMVETGDLMQVELPGQPPRYDLPKSERQPLMLCEKTNRVFFADNNKISLNIPKIDGFDVKGYQIILYGESEDGAEKKLASSVAN